MATSPPELADSIRKELQDLSEKLKKNLCEKIDIKDYPNMTEAEQSFFLQALAEHASLEHPSLKELNLAGFKEGSNSANKLMDIIIQLLEKQSLRLLDLTEVSLELGKGRPVTFEPDAYNTAPWLDPEDLGSPEQVIMKKLKKAFKANTSLRVLHLFNMQCVGVKDFESEFYFSFPVQAHLESLSVGCKRELSFNQSTSIFDFIKKIKGTLKRLMMGGLILEDNEKSSLSSLGRFLVDNKTVEVLRFDYCSFTAKGKGFPFLIAHLNVTRVSELSFRGVKGIEGGFTLVDTLKANELKHLVSLDLRDIEWELGSWTAYKIFGWSSEQTRPGFKLLLSDVRPSILVVCNALTSNQCRVLDLQAIVSQRQERPGSQEKFRFCVEEIQALGEALFRNASFERPSLESMNLSADPAFYDEKVLQAIKLYLSRNVLKVLVLGERLANLSDTWSKELGENRSLFSLTLNFVFRDQGSSPTLSLGFMQALQKKKTTLVSLEVPGASVADPKLAFHFQLFLKGNECIKKLNLANTDFSFSEDMFVELMYTFKTCLQLEDLNLNNTRFTWRVLPHLVYGLNGHPSLKTVQLLGSRLISDFTGVKPEAGVCQTELTKLISTCHNLTRLVLTVSMVDNSYEPEGPLKQQLQRHLDECIAEKHKKVRAAIADSDFAKTLGSSGAAKAILPLLAAYLDMTEPPPRREPTLIVLDKPRWPPSPADQ